jgi:hypothetical protein
MRTEAIDPDQVAAFLADLTALTQKHGIEIDGCGCCGSPYLWATDEVGSYEVTPFNVEDKKHWSGLQYVCIEEVTA